MWCALDPSVENVSTSISPHRHFPLQGGNPGVEAHVESGFAPMNVFGE